MVTSAGPARARRRWPAHLASSLARAGRKTLLLDGDLRRPTVHELFEMPMQPGFSEVLLGEVEVAEAVQATTLDGLSVIAAGQWDREVMLALARDGVEGIFERLARGVRLHHRRFAPRAVGHRFAADRPARRCGDPVGACARSARCRASTVRPSG